MVEIMASVDREHPLEVPPPMPGQCWMVGDDEIWVGSLLPSQKAPWIKAWPLLVPGAVIDPSKGAILVYGPGPWGANVPWMDTRVTS